MIGPTDDILAHYGVPGMKWGQRRSNRALARAKKERDANLRDANESSGGKTKRRRDAKDQTIYKQKAKNLTNEELKSRIQRLETERRYNDLNKKTVSKGQQATAEVLTNVGKSTATKIGNGALQYAIRQQITKKTNAVIAKQIVPTK